MRDEELTVSNQFTDPVFKPGEHVRVKPLYSKPSILGVWEIEKKLTANYQLRRPGDTIAKIGPRLRAKPWQLERVTSNSSSYATMLPTTELSFTPALSSISPGTIVTVVDPNGKIGQELYVIHRDNTYKNNTVELSQLGGGKAWKNVPRTWLTEVPLNKLREILCG